MSLIILIPSVAVVLSAIMAGAWAVAIRTGQSGWIDAIWSLAVGAVGVTSALVAIEGDRAVMARQVLVAILLAAWSLRLGLHIVQRTAKGGDDPRYAQLREDWGDRFKPMLFGFLQIQAAAAFVLVMTVTAAAHNPRPGLGLQDFAGVLVLAIAVIGEGIADRQLTAFKHDPANKGRVCDIGLWSVTRHPNYFFEWLGWVAYAVIAVGIDYPWGWAALAGPAFMYWLLVHASGIPPLEAHMLRSRPQAFRDYQSRVNAFWPGPPHTSKGATS